jgi:hypothetical protein
MAKGVLFGLNVGQFKRSAIFMALLILILGVAPRLSAAPANQLTQVGRTITFEDAAFPGTATAGTVTRMNYAGSTVLNVNPLAGSVSGSHEWVLALNSGEYDLSGKTLAEFSFDWWAEYARPWQNMFDLRLLTDNGRLLALRSTGDVGNNDNPPFEAVVGYALGNSDPSGGTGNTTIFSRVQRLTKYRVTISLNLETRLASIVLRNEAGIQVYSEVGIAIGPGKLSALSFGGYRDGANWAAGGRANPSDWDAVRETYGAKIDNLTISAGTFFGYIPLVYPSAVTFNVTEAALEYGPGADENLRSTTIRAEVSPPNASDLTFYWASSNSNVAFIEPGADGGSVVVSARGEGSAVISAWANLNERGRAPANATARITVTYRGIFIEPEKDFAGLVEDGWSQRFGSSFTPNDLWDFAAGAGSTVISEREGAGTVAENHYLAFTIANQSGNRSVSRRLPEAVSGREAYVSFDWKPGAVNNNMTSDDQNAYDLMFLDGSRPLLSIRVGRDANGGNRAGVFTAASIEGYNKNSFDNPAFTNFETLTSRADWIDRWYTVGVLFNFDYQKAGLTITERGGALIEYMELDFWGAQFTDLQILGRRTATNNMTFNMGLDNLYFFTKSHEADTILEVLPAAFLSRPPETADSTMKQSWFKTVYIGDATGIDDIGLPETVDVRTADGNTATVRVIWEVAEVPWAFNGAVNPGEQPGVYSFIGILGETVSGAAVDRMGVRPMIFVENRLRPEQLPRAAEWLDRGVVAVPVNAGTGVLVQWRLSAVEYHTGISFNVYRNGEILNDAPITTLNYLDAGGRSGDTYLVEAFILGQPRLLLSHAIALEHNYLEIPMQRPKDRENPANTFGAAGAPITYTANDISVADVDGDGRYELLVKWYPSQAQDPGLEARHTGETIFDCYTLDGELLWRINLGVNITSSAHHSAFNFFDLDNDGKAEFAVKTADGTRVYMPGMDGTIDDTEDEPVYVIGDLNAVWVGGVMNPVTGTMNDWSTGRVAAGPEYFTVFDGLTGLPVSTVYYFAPYERGVPWGDNDNNRSDRFNAAVAFMPKYDNPGVPYPTVIEVRGHYGPNFVAGYQLINREIVLAGEFVLADYAAGSFGNHNMTVADVDRDGFDEIIFGSIVLNSDGTPRWIADGSHGTTPGTHGDALHVSVMMSGSEEFFVMVPQESPAPNNVKVYNASTGELVWGYDSASSDVGRGMAANITPLPGFEVWASGGTPLYNLESGRRLGAAGNLSINFRLYWDGDLLSELLDGGDGQPLAITKFQYDVENGASRIDTLLELAGTVSNNGTKANPGLSADIFGDWREEIIVRTADNDSLRIYVTDIPTEYVIYTLMHDRSYRLAVNAQNAMYNQPPALGFYLGEDIRDEVLELRLPVPVIKWE